MADGPMLNAFLSEILQSLQARNGQRITDLIQLDVESLPPQRQKPYADLNGELNATYPPSKNDALSTFCKKALLRKELGSFNSSFSESVVLYFRYLRDFTRHDNQAKAYEIRQLTRYGAQRDKHNRDARSANESSSQCITALGDSNYGVIMIPIVLSFSRVLAKIATNLDRTSATVQQGTAAMSNADETGGSKVSFVESTANVLRDAFIKCLAGSPGSSRSVRPAPDDKRYGIYLTANSCLKLLWQCRKLRNAQQMFMSIDAQSPPLSFYPAAQRVTYLYYLGRYHLANNHFYRAQLALQAAYDQCHKKALKHRRLILIYLMTSNICLGRFPSQELFTYPEASDLAEYFQPLCQAIRRGDLASLHALLDLSSQSVHAQWFLHKRILLQLRDRCDILTWRSLIRRVFMITGYKGEDKKIPFLRLHQVQHAAQWLARTERQQTASRTGFTPSNHGQNYVDSDFVDLDSAISETGFDVETGAYQDELMGQSSTVLHAEGEMCPSLYEVESIFLSLIQQGFLRGFALHNPGNPRFAIPGSQAAGGPVLKGFPRIWDIVESKQPADESVPGWVKDNILTGGTLRSGARSLGGVVRLSGARPVGMGS